MFGPLALLHVLANHWKSNARRGCIWTFKKVLLMLGRILQVMFSTVAPMWEEALVELLNENRELVEEYIRNVLDSIQIIPIVNNNVAVPDTTAAPRAA